MVAGMTSVCCMADALGFARIVIPAFFCAQTPKGFEDISSRKVETRNEIQTQMETRRASTMLHPTASQVQKAAYE